MQTFPKPLAMVLILCFASSVAAAPIQQQQPHVGSVTETVQAARKVMMNDPAAALALGVELERRAADVPGARERRIVIAKAKWIAGEANLRLHRINEARSLIEASYALSVASGDLQSQGEALLSRGSIKKESGDSAGALQDILEAYQLFQHTADARSRSITLQDLSQLYADAQDYTRAETYLRQAIEAYRGEPVIQLALANNMANVLAEQGDYTGAESELRRGLLIARTLRVHALELQLLGNLVLTQLKQQHLDEASRTADEIAEVSRRTGTRTDNQTRSSIARLALAQGRINHARGMMDEILAPADGKLPALDHNLHTTAYEIYKAGGATRLALSHLETAGRLRNEAVALGISNKAALMAARFDFEMQDLRIAALKAAVLRRDIALEHDAAERDRTIFAAVGLLVLVVIALLAVWLTVLRRSRDRFRAVSVRLEQSNAALEAAFQEVAERVRAERDATELALHDALTGLPNRRQLSENFQADLQGKNGLDRGFFVLLLDLDRFKQINDRHGHGVGDRVLVATADRLKLLCAQFDAKAVRLGGDEFVVLMTGLHGAEAAERLADDIIQVLRAPIDIGELRVTLGASIGVARYPQDGASIDDLLRAADYAMYEAKRSGQNTFRIFDRAMKARQRLRAV